MSLALLSGANPRACKVGPKVRLHEGSWKFKSVGVADSSLLLHLDEMPLHLTEDLLLETSGCTVYLTFDKVGTEPHISIFAEPVNAIKSTTTS